MTTAASIAKISESQAGLGVVVIVGAVVAYFLLKNAFKGIVYAGKEATTELAGLATGNNSITAAATDAQGHPVSAYQGAGILGTLGAATDEASGGFLATWGENLGGWLADKLQVNSDNPASAGKENGYSIQSSSNRPYNNGPTNAYAKAINGGTDPTYTATVIVTDSGTTTTF